MDNYNYPVGSDTPNAPWNQVDLPEREIEVTISVTLSKTVKIKVDDYRIADCGSDEDGDYFEDIDYSECDLHSAVKSQIILPQEAYHYIKTNTSQGSKAFKDLMDWNVDDLEVIKE